MNGAARTDRPEPWTGPLETPLLVRIRGILRDEVDPEFEFSAPRPIPFTPLCAPLSGTRVALVTTAGLHRVGDAPFRCEEERLGDTSFRILPQDLPASALELEASYVDAKYVRRDPEVALPRAALEALAAAGRIGGAAPRHLGFVGGIVRPWPGLAESAERAHALLSEDAVGAAVLLPTCSLCVQAMAFLAQELERRGTATVLVSLLPELSRIVGAPRALTVHFPFGAPVGDPGNVALHRTVLTEALELVATAREPGLTAATTGAWRR